MTFYFFVQDTRITLLDLSYGKVSILAELDRNASTGNFDAHLLVWPRLFVSPANCFQVT